MKFIQLNEEIFTYIQQQNPPIHECLTDLREETSKLPYSQMQISHEQGSFLRFLAGTITAKRILEVGCFTGYSALCMASALPDNGELITCDIDEERTKVALKYFAKAGLGEKIQLRLGPAKDTLTNLLTEKGAASFDMAFLDADKKGMKDYYEQCLNLVRPGGLIICDNVLWGGSVVNDKNATGDTLALQKLNEDLREDPRVDKTFVNIADGLFILRRL